MSAPGAETPATPPLPADTVPVNPPWPALARAAIAAAIVAVALAIRVRGADTGLFLLVNGWHAVPDAIWEALTVAGLGLTGIVLATLAARDRPRALAALAWSFALGGGVVQLFKQTCSMPRPDTVLGDGHVRIVGPMLHWNSMPSGHTLTAVALVTILWLEGGPRLRRPLVGFVAGVLAVGVGLSRIVVGAHFPADVLAGAAIGWGTAWLSIDLARRTHLDRLFATAFGWWLLVALQAGAGVALVVVDTRYPGAAPFADVLGGLAALLAVRDAVARFTAGRGARPEARA